MNSNTLNLPLLIWKKIIKKNEKRLNQTFFETVSFKNSLKLFIPSISYNEFVSEPHRPNVPFYVLHTLNMSLDRNRH